MTLATRAFVEKVRRLTEQEEPICQCSGCREAMYYGETAFKTDDDEIMCNICFDDWVRGTYGIVLDDAYIPEPDWDKMEGGHDE